MPQRGTDLGVAKDVFGRGPVLVPVLHRSGFGRGSDIEVGHDERVAIDGVVAGELADQQGSLRGPLGYPCWTGAIMVVRSR